MYISYKKTELIENNNLFQKVYDIGRNLLNTKYDFDLDGLITAVLWVRLSMHFFIMHIHKSVAVSMSVQYARSPLQLAVWPDGLYDTCVICYQSFLQQMPLWTQIFYIYIYIIIIGAHRACYNSMELLRYIRLHHHYHHHNQMLTYLNVA